MPIIELQRRLREIGRIRIGEQVPTSNGKTRPAKLDVFRLTSKDRHVVDIAAQQFGGSVEAWESPDGDAWQVKTRAKELTVIVPPQDMAFSQWYELWSAGGCQRRCDGQTEYLGERDCVCDPDQRECAIHSRLSVILPDLPGLGVWRLDTSGYYAAVELGGVVEIAAAYAAHGQMLPARLRLEQRSVKRPGRDGKPETRRFAVPTLDLDVNPMALASGGGAVPAIGAGASAAFDPVPVDALPAAPVASVADQVSSVNDPAAKQARKNAAAPIPSTGLAPRTAQQAEGGRVCTRCGQPLGGAVVERDGDGYAHKDGCPTPVADDDVAVEDKPGGSPVTAKQVGTAATKAFPCDDAPRGEKTKQRERLRHALQWAVSKGRTIHFADLEVTEQLELLRTLEGIVEGKVTFAPDDDGVMFLQIATGQEIEVSWSDLAEPEESQ